MRFPFGFGLSYTTFAYDRLTVDEQGVAFDVTNTGTQDGDEIVQLYVSLPGAKIFRPKVELKGFARIHLQAGETKRVHLPFDEYTFRYFNVQTGSFEIEGGNYQILIGASCEDIRLRAAWQVKGTGKPNPMLPCRSSRIAPVRCTMSRTNPSRRCWATESRAKPGTEASPWSETIRCVSYPTPKTLSAANLPGADPPG